MAQTLISLKGVGRAFGSRRVFGSVTLDLAEGQTLLVLGPNGAGKTTLLKIMAGLASPTAGSVERQVGLESCAYLGHATFIYPRLSALENLGFWAGMYGLRTDDRDLLAVLRRVELNKFADEPAGRFSRGMAQRLNLARVLLIGPRLLFLDEPSTGLDTRSLDILLREIASARARGAAIAWVSHDLARDLPLADLALVLGGLKPVYFGPAADYRVEPQVCPAPEDADREADHA